MIPSPTTLTWRHFEDLPSGPGAASVAACCAFSLSTLEVASTRDSSGFALTERRQPEIWRWAIIGLDGTVLEEGCEPSQDEAKRSAAEALALAMAESDEPSAAASPDLEHAAAGKCTLPAAG